jgi:hypothetical protein
LRYARLLTWELYTGPVPITGWRLFSGIPISSLI